MTTSTRFSIGRRIGAAKRRMREHIQACAESHRNAIAEDFKRLREAAERPSVQSFDHGADHHDHASAQ